MSIEDLNKVAHEISNPRKKKSDIANLEIWGYIFKGLSLCFSIALAVIVINWMTAKNLNSQGLGDLNLDDLEE